MSSGKSKKVTIKVMGEEYVIRSPSSREHMLEVGEYVNNLMQQLAERYPRMSLQKIAVLCCLNLASDLLTLQKKNKKNKGDS